MSPLITRFLKRHALFMEHCAICTHHIPGESHSPRCGQSQEVKPPLCYVERIDPMRCGNEAKHYQPKDK